MSTRIVGSVIHKDIHVRFLDYEESGVASYLGRSGVAIKV
jgi:hypothetical protein